jgi:hypothetical protein
MNFVLHQAMEGSLMAKATRSAWSGKHESKTQAERNNLAASDDYAQWLLAQRATIQPDLDLEI